MTRRAGRQAAQIKEIEEHIERLDREIEAEQDAPALDDEVLEDMYRARMELREALDLLQGRR